ncbi:DUF6560 family protein [Enterococcus sp. AZ109]|uniref:DUF6560 family protein n=1 Tax=Enterococcus sp. AZ109 TaxID=2774634 RepID=UPI003F2427B6
MDTITVCIISAAVAATIDYLIYRVRQRETSSAKKYVIRAPKEFMIIGIFYTLFFAGCFLLARIQSPEEVIDGYLIFMVVLVFALGGLLMIAPIPGIWDVIVDDDDITVIKCFIFKKHWKLSKVVRAKQTRGGLKCYVAGRKRKAFFVDKMCENVTKFIKCLEKQNIPIEWMKDTPSKK